MPKGFNKVSSDIMPPRRLVMRIGGFDKEGKTHFALTMPSPIGIVNIDRGLEGMYEKFAREKELYISDDFRAMPLETKEDNEARWNAIMGVYIEYLESSIIRSILYDTDTEAWEIARLAYLGKLVGVRELHYPEVNSIFRKVIDMALAHDKNVIFTCRLRKQYIKSKSVEGKDTATWNGKYEESGFGEFGAIAQATLRAKIINVDGENVPTIKVVNCRQNMQMNGEVFEGDGACFSWVAANIIEGTSPEEWE